MKDFVYYAPTEVVFGDQSEDKVAGLVKKYGGHKVLVHYGGGSVKKSGLLDKVCNLLKEFILAVGGGSVIDSSKAIAYGVPYEGEVWDVYLRKYSPEKALPIGCVLTIPAAGSEMSDSSVITNEEGWVKLGYSNNICRAKFAIMNPCRTYTLPPYQTAAGVTDIMMHTMERYFTQDDDMDITTELAEALLRTMKESVFAVLKDPCNYRHRAQIMWAGSLAHNDLTGCGVTGDWATHQLGHELSGLFDATHGASLAAMWPSWARYVYKANVSRFVRFAVNVMDVPNDFTDPEGTALKGIEAMERFYNRIGMPINIKGLIGREVTEEEIKEMTRKCSRNYTTAQGMFKKLEASDIEAIYRMAKG